MKPYPRPPRFRRPVSNQTNRLLFPIASRVRIEEGPMHGQTGIILAHGGLPGGVMILLDADAATLHTDSPELIHISGPKPGAAGRGLYVTDRLEILSICRA